MTRTGTGRGVVAVVCARMSSSRLPGKVLMPVLGRPALERLLERLACAVEVDTIVVATSDHSEDDAVADLARVLGHAVYRGSLDDVLGRVYGAAQSVGAQTVVEVTGDMVLLDPGVIDLGVVLLHQGGYEYVTNVAFDPASGATQRSYPMGVNAVVFSLETLRRCAEEADSRDCREHVSLYADLHTERFRRHFFAAPEALARPAWRFALDYPEDLIFINAVYEHLWPGDPAFAYREVLALLERRPELLAINDRCERGVEG